MRAKILVQSNKRDTYINVMAALCNQYRIEKIMLSFIEDIDDSLVNNINYRLAELAKDDASSMYLKASRVSIETEVAGETHKTVVKGWDIVDVTAVSKELAIQFSAASISNKKIHVCQLSWTKIFDKNEDWILEKDNYTYSDLMSSGALSNLYKDYFQKNHVIFLFFTLFLIVFLTVVIKIVIPSFIVPEYIVNLLSLLIGGAGLYLAILSFKSTST